MDDQRLSRPEGTADTEAAADAAAVASERADDSAAVAIMDLLQQHVPLTLLTDLTDPGGPSSPVILEQEGLPEVAWWEAGEAASHDDAPPEA